VIPEGGFQGLSCWGLVWVIQFRRMQNLGLVFLTLVTGAMAGFTTVQAMTGKPGSCVVFCE